MLARTIYAIIVAALAALTAATPSDAMQSTCPAILDHKFANLMDEPISLCQFSGKIVLIVNTASECGYTPQYEGMEKLYRRYRDKGFVALGFSANDFGTRSQDRTKRSHNSAA
jgi:glutathione peroxidase